MNNQSNRIFFMDSMRSVLMVLGVVLHSSNVFNTGQWWLVSGGNTSTIADNIGQLIHIFRMPTFFVISGFFCAFTINKYNPKKFFTIRMQRLVIPLITTAVVLNSLQEFILIYGGFRNYEIKKYFLEGEWVSHLWFLNNLIIYFSAATILFVFFKEPIQSIGKYLSNLCLTIPLIVVILFMPIASIVILGLNKIGFPLYFEAFGVLRINIIFMYLPYFIFGTLLSGNSKLLYKFSQINPILILITIISAVFIMQNFSLSNGTINKIMFVYLEKLIVWLSISLCFYVFYHFFNAPSKKWLFLSDASYTVYLFHHVFVVAIGMILVRLGVPVLFGLFFLMLITTIITLCIHKYFILHFKYARLLFNGK